MTATKDEKGIKMELTREEILNMPVGSEIDTLIAVKIMKWMKYCPHISTEYYFSGWFIKCPDGLGLCVAGEDWSPSTDIAAAWEVVEKIKNNYLMTDMYWQFEKWHVVFGVTDRTVQAPTAPLAICRAALLAVMENK